MLTCSGGEDRVLVNYSVAHVQSESVLGIGCVVHIKSRVHSSLKCFTVGGGTVKGILHQKNFYRLNLIFWIVMGCGIARFGRRGLKTTET